MQEAKQTIIFETERLIVRQFNAGDKDNFFLLSGDTSVMQYIRAVSTREESDKFLQENIDGYETKPHKGRWAVVSKADGSFVGSCAIIPLPNDKEKIQLGYSLRPENWGKGYATELAKGCLDYFMTNYSLPEIYGVTETPNVASQKVLLKIGFQSSGSFMEGEKELLLFIAKR